MDNTAYELNLQLFAEPDENTASGAEEQAAETQAEKTFTQAELDKIVAQRLQGAQRSFDRKLEQALKDARSEGEKLAQMTADQRFQHEREQAERTAREREAGLSAREAAIARREMRAEAIDKLVNQGLPAELADLLVYTSAEDCDASIEKVAQIHRKAVQADVERHLRKSSAPLTRGADGSDALIAQMRKAAGLPDKK